MTGHNNKGKVIKRFSKYLLHSMKLGNGMDD